MNKDLLIVDDDLPFKDRLSKSMEKKDLLLNLILTQNPLCRELKKRILISQ